MPGTRSAFSDYSPRAARWVLVAAAALAALCVAITFSPLRSGFTEKPRFQAPTDIDLYAAEIRRIRAGGGYYQAAATELRARGYPTKSVFNWRTPLPMWLIAKLPEGMGKVLAAGLASILILATLVVVAREGSLFEALLAGLLQFGAVMPCFLGQLYVMPVLWAGILMALSACAYSQGRWKLGLGSGLAALFLRDLAGPYCVLCALLAARERRWREAALWGAGLLAYGVFYGVHLGIVRGLMRPEDVAHVHGWVQLGGLPFVISTVQMNSYLLILPQWATAAYFAAAMLGLAGWHNKAGERFGLAVCLYVLLFGFVGQPFNQYWGALVTPLFCFGAARAWTAGRDLWAAAKWKEVALEADDEEPTLRPTA
ncbi:MAG: hypothetical protein HYS13_04465 [Planctomycetia bacterium]|nr:hypothetical protein [Planctomycetia bacterium]